MSTDVQGGEAAVVETAPNPPAEAGFSSQESEVNFEAEARKMGWVPEEEFKGDKKPAKFLSAEEFYNRGQEVLPIVKAHNRDLSKRLEEAEATNKRMVAMFEKTLAKQREEATRQIETLKAAQRQAIKAGDDEKADQIDQQIDVLKEEAKGDAQPTARTVDELTRDFAKVNTWFVEEPDMAEYAIKVSESNAALNEGISFEDNMKFVVGAVRKKFPSYFKEMTAANGHAAVDAGGSFPGAQPQKGPSSKLNATELAQARKDVAAGLYKNTDEWAKVYFG